MNIEVTERERKLLDYINKLLTVVSLLSLYIYQTDKLIQWAQDGLNAIHSSELEEDLIGYLKSEFGLEYRKITNEEISGKE